MTQTVGIGLVGCGMIAGVQAEAIASLAQSSPAARLVAVCTRDATRGEAFVNRYGGTAYQDYEAFLAHPGLDLVSICTPSGTHAAYGVRAAAAGRHVLVEKPIEIDLARADLLIEACDRHQVRLGVIFQSRFLPAVQQIYQAVQEGRLGKIFLADAIVKWYREPSYYAVDSWHGTLALDGGGALINQAIHTVDLLRWIVGPVRQVAAFRGALRYPHLEGEDTLVASLQFERGALGMIEAATSAKPGFQRRLEISGERGSILLEGDSIAHWSIDGEAPPSLATEELTNGSANPAAISAEGHRRQIAEMVEAILEHRPPVIDGREGRRSLELVEAIYHSARDARFVEVATAH
jgi:UDP-N-acetyl-2-amino-2-deoxyglucuronate dehydrogenase